MFAVDILDDLRSFNDIAHMGTFPGSGMVRRQRIDHKGVLVFAYVCVMERGCCGLFGYVDIYRDWLIDRSRHVEVYFLSFHLSSTSVTNV